MSDRRESSWTRRKFLGSMAVAPLAWTMTHDLRSEPSRSVVIDKVDILPARYPMKGYFKFFAGAGGSEGRAAVFVKITASDGTVGWGQSVPIAKWSYETLETATIALRDYFGPALIGHDPTDISGAHEILDGAIAAGFSTGMPIARAGIDIALWDLAGKLAGKPIAELWGKRPGGRLTLSWTVNVRDLAEVKAIVAAGREQGYEHFNIKVAPDPDFDVALARKVREEAPRAFLWADANGGYDPRSALAAAPRLARAGVDVLEAPVRPNRIRAYRELVAQGALPILMDEGVVSAVELEEFIELGMLDGVAMKPSRCGGLSSCKAQIELVERRGLLWLGSGLTDPEISLAATLILYAAFQLEKPAALNGAQFLADDVLAKPLAIEGGKAT
ncbi:MAG TPA: enolase C-terminal domain-like protein, partial [Planctomycetota bacterium]|nr:enolase C-terminal domain-like protein [Planctomycetota bacterium]